MAASCFWMTETPGPPAGARQSPQSDLILKSLIRNGMRSVRFPQATIKGQKGGFEPVPCLARSALLPAMPCATRNPAYLAHRLPIPAMRRHSQKRRDCQHSVCRQQTPNTGSHTMPAVHQPARAHRNAGHTTPALGGGVPFRCVLRAGQGQHAARCMHLSAERRLQARSPKGARVGAGRWPFHACAICAPPPHL